MTIREWLSLATQKLPGDSPELEAQVLLARSLGVDRSWLLAHRDDALPEAVMAEAWLKRRVAREPLAYILGDREFYGRTFRVTPDVLIPRQETELLVDIAVQRRPDTLLDLGTGSGCLAVTIALELPDCRVTGSDISARALPLAQENGARLGASVEWVESDWFANITGTFDLVVSNPPYVGPQEPLEPELTDWEPHLALYAEEGGLAAYRAIASSAAPFLSRGGAIAVEHGWTQREAVEAVFAEFGWASAETRSDLDGHDRVSIFTLP